MKTHNFYATNGTDVLKGTLIVSNTKNKILFDTTLPEFKDMDIKEKSIKDVKNFIASLIRRLDINERFEKVKVARTEVSIIREGIKPSEQSMNVFIDGGVINQRIFFEQDIKLNNVFGESETFSMEELRLKLVSVPFDFAYSRDPLLNDILKFNVAPIDYDKTINNKLLKLVKLAKQQLSKNPDAKYIFANKRLNDYWFDTDRFTSYSWVIPVELIPDSKIKIKKELVG